MSDTSFTPATQAQRETLSTEVFNELTINLTVAFLPANPAVPGRELVSQVIHSWHWHNIMLYEALVHEFADRCGYFDELFGKTIISRQRDEHVTKRKLKPFEEVNQVITAHGDTWWGVVSEILDDDATAELISLFDAHDGFLPA